MIVKKTSFKKICKILLIVSCIMILAIPLTSWLKNKHFLTTHSLPKDKNMVYEKTLTFKTNGEALYSITKTIQQALPSLIQDQEDGVLFIFVPHTSCALLISEDWDPSAKEDVEAFIKKLVPRNQSYFQHTLEGEDDSPSHIKSALLHQHLAFPIHRQKIALGQWQGVFLAEFRDHSHNRSILLKFIPG